jgi:glycosyltransferase involved in cell wall biosynthesis
MIIENKQVVIVSNEPWGDVWFSKHNYAYELSRKNEVVFINPCGKWSIKNLFHFHITMNTVSPNLKVLSYTNFFPALNSFFFNLNDRLVSVKINKYLKKQNFQSFLLWTFDPYRLCDPAILGAGKSVFHCVDKYDFTHFGEKTIYEKVDYIFLVSNEFRNDYLPYHKPLFLCPHGISSDEFDANSGPKTEAAGAVLYIGNIDQRLDYSLLERALIRFPEHRFVFIGKERFVSGNAIANRIFRDKKYPNLVCLGVIPFKKLKNYISDSLCCIALMDKDHKGNLISHHKIFQYLAQGKPVFCNRFSEYADASKLLYMSNDPEALLNSMQHFFGLGENELLAKERIHYASAYKFQTLLEKAGTVLYENQIA